MKKLLKTLIEIEKNTLRNRRKKGKKRERRKKKT